MVTAQTWEAKGPYIFEGSDCIAVFDTDNASTKKLVARAKLAAGAVNCHDDLLALAHNFRRTVLFYIGMDERKGDDEGASLKRNTLFLIDEILAKVERI